MSFSMSRLDAHWFHAACLEEWDEMKTEWRRTRVLGMLSTFKYHQVCVCAPTHPPTHRSSIWYLYDTNNFSLLMSFSLRHSLGYLTADLDIIVATYKCTPPTVNLSMSFSWCSSCSLSWNGAAFLMSNNSDSQLSNQPETTIVARPREDCHQPTGVKNCHWLTAPFKLDLH